MVSPEDTVGAMPRDERFILRVISLPGEDVGALLFLAETFKGVSTFLSRFMQATFASGGQGGSRLSIGTKNDGVLLLESRGGGHVVSIGLTAVPASVGRLVEQTIKTRGSIPLLFGFGHDNDPVLLHPRHNHLIKSDAVVDDAALQGRTQYLWDEFLSAIARDFQTVEVTNEHAP